MDTHLWLLEPPCVILPAEEKDGAMVVGSSVGISLVGLIDGTQLVVRQDGKLVVGPLLGDWDIGSADDGTLLIGTKDGSDVEGMDVDGTNVGSMVGDFEDGLAVGISVGDSVVAFGYLQT